MQRSGIGRRGLLLASAGLAALARPALAQQTFPLRGRPIVLVGNFAAGGIVGKAMQDFQPFFEREFRTRVNIETIEGAAGLIGYNTVFARPADGHYILPCSSTFGPYIYPHLSQARPPWKYEDWVNLGIYSDTPNSGIVVRRDSPLQTFPDLVKAARARPGRITIGTIGPGRIEDVQIIEMQRFFNIELRHVYYDSGSTLFTDLLTRDLDCIITAAVQYANHRDAVIQTMLCDELGAGFPYPHLKSLGDWQQELGFRTSDLKTLNSTQTNGLMVKAGLPDAAYQRLVEGVRNVVANPEWKERVKSYRNPVWYPPERAKQIFDRINEGIGALIAHTRRT